MEKIIRSIRPEIRAVDGESGRIVLVASTEACDSYNEVVCHDAYDLTLFKKNAPLPDSHRYESIQDLLGSVTDARVDRSRRQLICEAQLAIDVPENARARLAYGMIKKGHLRACSIGFFPVEYLSPSDGQRYESKLSELSLAPSVRPSRIYTRVKLIELSLVILGANPDALISARNAGLVNDRDFALMQKSFPVRTQEKKALAVSRLSAIAAKFEPPSPSQIMKHATSETPEIITDPNAFARALRAIPASLQRDCELVLCDPEKRQHVRSLAYVFCRAPKHLWGAAEEKMLRAVTTGDSDLGQALSVYEPLAADVYVLLHKYAAFRTLGVVPMEAGKKKLAKVTGKPTAVWVKPSSQGAPSIETPTISGSSISPEASTVSALIKVSGELFSDGGITFEGALLAAIVAGLGYRIDFTCLQADGTDDLASGGMTGIFSSGDVPSVACESATAVSDILSSDFDNLIGRVNSSAYAYPCRFWISASFLPKLLKVRSDTENAGESLLKPPTSATDEWRINGWPVTWTDAAPNTEAAGAKIAAFGRCDAYTVGLRKDFGVTASPHQEFNSNNVTFKALARARCEIRDASSLATLKLKA